MKLRHIREFGTKDISDEFSGSQAPLMGYDLTVYATTRDRKNISHPVRLGRLIEHDDLTFTLTQEDKVFSHYLGPKGSCYSNGLMLSQVLDNLSVYTGWTLGADDQSTSRNTILMCYNTSCQFLGVPEHIIPVDDNKIGMSMGFIDGCTMYYMSFQGWHNKEALYSIRSCSIYFNDQENNTPETYNYKDVLSGGFCYARPVIIERNNYKELWYCYREFGKRNYKPGCLFLSDDGVWFPKEIETEEEIVAYPYPFVVDNRTYVLYNNDRSLRGNIQLAEVIDD